MLRTSNDWLYPQPEPYRTGRLKVTDLHDLYFEEVGNPKGKPVIYLHGGPGAGLSSFHRRFHNPEKYRVILFDQRGAGKSTPAASLEQNTTWDLVADIEKLREHLGIEKWQVFGGSWGSTLALAYSETHPERATEIILRGIFLGTKEELDWFYGGKGANFIFPDLWENYVSLIPESERGNMIAAYYKRLTSTDTKIRQEAARRWAVWEYSLVSLLPSPDMVKEAGETEQAEKVARIECHYFMNNCFFKTDNYLIENVSKIRNIPAVIVHGRYDLICPSRFAWNLHKAWPEADCYFIPDAGHAVIEPGISKTLINATDRFAG
jgi:proline iminopeptidase